MLRRKMDFRERSCGVVRKRASVVFSFVVIAFALLFCVYPAVIVGTLLVEPALRNTGQSCLVPLWFESLAGRYQGWASSYLTSGTARSVETEDVSGTEWPMFGSVFFLVTSEELARQGKIALGHGRVRQAVEKAVEVVVSPDTATWVRTKWGASYLEHENVFYRMLLILGTSSYERMTGDRRYHTLMMGQARGLARELDKAPYHVLDDYPGECWPNDVLWAVAAIRRALSSDGEDCAELVRALMATLDGSLKVGGLPAFTVDKETGNVIQCARGCGMSGILPFAAELDVDRASRWYQAYDDLFWQQTAWLAGFREFPKRASVTFSDVDSGPVVFGLGSVASAFGIGAAKSVGRMDRAAPLTLEAVACSWPTPFGFILPSLMGKIMVGGGPLAETALLFSMTRPNMTEKTIPFSGPVPGLVWVLWFAYVGSGMTLIGFEIRALRLALKRKENKDECV